MILLLGCLAASAAAPAGPAPPPERDPEALIWSGVVLPLFGANTQDGVGLGLGGEIFTRPRSQDEGYLLKLTASLWVTTDLGYTSDFVQLDYRGPTRWLGRVGFRGWTNHAYVGEGGGRVLLDQGPAELGNVVYGPFAFLGVARPLDVDRSWFAQLAYRTMFVDAAPGSYLATRRPVGAAGGSYVDATFGVEHDTTSRWPMPHNGVRAEASLRGGASVVDGAGARGVFGGNAEVIAWHEAGRHLVLGGRLVVDKTFGARPFFETDSAGGRWRDELGSEQTFAGYGRTRTRGDGMVAAMVELRPYLFRTRHPFLDFEFHASLFAEQGWLFDGLDPGPPLPTVGFGPQVLFQGAIQLRPFLAWGWRAEVEGGRRRPTPQFGVSFLDPL